MKERAVEDIDPWADSDETRISDHEAKALIQSGAEIRRIEEENEKLIWYSADDAGNAESVRYLHGDNLCYVGAYGWLVWNGYYYEQDEEKVKGLVMETLKRRRGAAAKAGDHEKVVQASKADAYRVHGCMDLLKALVSVKVEEFDADSDTVNVLNGVLDLRTGECKPHTPKQKFTYCIPVNYNPEADYTAWEDFLLKSVTGGQEVVKFMQVALGYTLTGRTSEECLFYVYGPARAGKGTFVEVVREMMGEPLSNGVSFSTFTQQRVGQNFDLAGLKASRAIVASESERHERINSSVVKDITGGGTIHCAFKHRDFFSYKPIYKIWLTSNWPINGDPDDEALWRRLKVIEFPHGQEEGKEDPKVKEGFKTQESLEAVLNWAVVGAMEWYKSGKLVTPEACMQVRQKHRDEADSVGQWLEACCIPVPMEGESRPTKVVRASYLAWCEGNGFKPRGAKTFNESLRRRGFKPGVNVRPRQGDPVNSIVGLVILGEEEERVPTTAS